MIAALATAALGATLDDFRACADGDAERCLAAGALPAEPPDGATAERTRRRALAALARGCDLGSGPCCEALAEDDLGLDEGELYDLRLSACDAGNLALCRALVEENAHHAERACAAGLREACDLEALIGVRGGPAATALQRFDLPRTARLAPADRGVLAVLADDPLALELVSDAGRTRLLAPQSVSGVPLRPLDAMSDSERTSVLLSADDERRLLVLGPDGARLAPVDDRLCYRLSPTLGEIDPGPAPRCRPGTARRPARIEEGRVAELLPLPEGATLREDAPGPDGAARWLVRTADGAIERWTEGARVARREPDDPSDPVLIAGPWGEDLWAWSKTRVERWDGASLVPRWRLETGPSSPPSPSPDGRWLAVGTTHGELLLVARDTGTVAQRVRLPCSDPLWDGRGDLWCDSDGLARLTVGAGTEARPSPAPDAWQQVAGLDGAWLGATLSGLVRSASGPVADARIRLDGRDAARTDARGRYDVAHVRLGTRHVEASHPGFLDADARIRVAPRGATADLALVPDARVDLALEDPPRPGEPAPDEVVVRCGSTSQSVPFRSDSAMGVEGLPPGETCSAHTDPFGPDPRPFWRAQFTAGTDRTAALTRPDPTGGQPTVAVTLLDAAGLPVAGVWPKGSTALSDPEGRTRILPSALGQPIPELGGSVTALHREDRWIVTADRIRATVEPGEGSLWVRDGDALASPDRTGTLWLRPDLDHEVLWIDGDTVGRDIQRISAEHRTIARPAPSDPLALELEVLEEDGLPAVGRSVQARFAGLGTPLATTVDLAGRARIPTPDPGPHELVVSGVKRSFSARPNTPATLALGSPAPEPLWEARAGPFGPVVIGRDRSLGEASLTWGDVVLEACGEDVRRWSWERLSERVMRSGGCPGEILRGTERIELPLPPPSRSP